MSNGTKRAGYLIAIMMLLLVAGCGGRLHFPSDGIVLHKANFPNIADSAYFTFSYQHRDYGKTRGGNWPDWYLSPVQLARYWIDEDRIELLDLPKRFSLIKPSTDHVRVRDRSLIMLKIYCWDECREGEQGWQAALFDPDLKRLYMLTSGLTATARVLVASRDGRKLLVISCPVKHWKSGGREGYPAYKNDTPSATDPCGYGAVYSFFDLDIASDGSLDIRLAAKYHVEEYFTWDEDGISHEALIPETPRSRQWLRLIKEYVYRTRKFGGENNYPVRWLVEADGSVEDAERYLVREDRFLHDWELYGLYSEDRKAWDDEELQKWREDKEEMWRIGEKLHGRDASAAYPKKKKDAVPPFWDGYPNTCPDPDNQIRVVYAYWWIPATKKRIPTKEFCLDRHDHANLGRGFKIKDFGYFFTFFIDRATNRDAADKLLLIREGKVRELPGIADLRIAIGRLSLSSDRNRIVLYHRHRKKGEKVSQSEYALYDIRAGQGRRLPSLRTQLRKALFDKNRK